MYELLVLGLIPGTEIRITFGVWIVAASALAAWTMWRTMIRTRLFGVVMISVLLMRGSQRLAKNRPSPPIEQAPVV